MASNQVTWHNTCKDRNDGEPGLWLFLGIMTWIIIVAPALDSITFSAITFGDIWHTVVCSVVCFPVLLIIALWLIHDAYSTQKDKNRTPEERAKILEENERIYNQCYGLDPEEQEETERQDRKDQNKRWMETQKRIIGKHQKVYKV